MKTAHLKIEIIEYTEAFAKSVADMWNRSGEGWNGRDFSETEKTVKMSEKNSQHLKLYLAVDAATLTASEPLVLGYCKVSKYYFDDETLYINLLNVDPAYHGAKIGKMLVLKAVDYTVSYGYPRLDLFTWPGNTKAVPLYKKCGFFWENAETGSTHLMNFIPCVLQDPMVKKSMEGIDWYQDSTRKILVKTDGECFGGTEYYTYQWEKEGKRVRCEFEKTSRGLCAFENDDYEVRLINTSWKRVFAEHYLCEVLFKPKRHGETFEIEVEGLTDKTIETKLFYSTTLSEETVFTGEFYVEPIEGEQNEWKTHPSVAVKVKINGVETILKTGVKPMKPLEIEWVNEQDIARKHQVQYMRLNLENAMDETSAFELHLPQIPEVAFSENLVKVTLNPKEKKSIQLTYNAQNAYVGTPEVQVLIVKSGKQYTQKTNLSLPVYGGQSVGGTLKYDTLYNDTKAVQLDRHFDFSIVGFMNLQSMSSVEIFQPRIGFPYTSEFERKLYSDVQFENGNLQRMTHVYESDDFPGTVISRTCELSPEGALKISHKCLKLPEDKNVSVSLAIQPDEEIIFMPYEGTVVKLDEETMGNLSLKKCDVTLIDEPWLYMPTYEGSIGIHWSEDVNLQYVNHALEWEFPLRQVGDETPAIYVHLDAFSNAEAFRRYALGKNVSARSVIDGLTVSVNQNNPFVVQNHVAIDVFNVNPQEKERQKSVLRYTHSDKTYEHHLAQKVNLPLEAPITVISGVLDNVQKERTFNKTVFKVSGDCELKAFTVEDTKVYQVDNGHIQMRLAPKYSHGVYSIVCDGKERLDHNFPVKEPKLWFNPWSGGYVSKFNEITDLQLADEVKTARFVTMEDGFGNLWTGIASELLHQTHNKLKTAKMTTFFMTLPGIPVVAKCVAVEATQDVYLKKRMHTKCFFAKGSQSAAFDSQNEKVKNLLKGESVEHILMSRHLIVEDERQQFTHQYTQEGTKLVSVMEEDLAYTELYESVVVDSKKAHMSKVDFLIFSSQKIPFNALKDLDGLCFNLETLKNKIQ